MQTIRNGIGSFGIVLSLLVGGCFDEGGDLVDLIDEQEEQLEVGEVGGAEDGEGAELAGADDVEAPTDVAAAAAASCELHIGVTRRSGNTISGYGSQANCGSSGTSYLTIQRSRWYGWEDLRTATVTGSGHDVYVSYNCAGTGTHTFRTIHTGRTIGGEPRFKESNHIRVTCD